MALLSFTLTLFLFVASGQVGEERKLKKEAVSAPPLTSMYAIIHACKT